MNNALPTEPNGTLKYKGRTIRVERLDGGLWQLREGNERLALLATKAEAIEYGRTILRQS